jgi:hypothetical protein
MATDEVVLEDYSDIKLLRGRVLNKVTLLFFDQDNAKHHTFLNAARVATHYRKNAVTVELLQPIHYVS